MKSKIRVFKKDKNYLRVLTDKGKDRNKCFFVHYSRTNDKKRRSLFLRLDNTELRLSGTQARGIWRIIKKTYSNGGGFSYDFIDDCLVSMSYKPKRSSSLLLSTSHASTLALDGRKTRTLWNVLNKVYG